MAITPKIVIHNLVTDHVHNRIDEKNDGKKAFHKSGIYCDCNNVVATSPFTPNDFICEINAPVCLNQYKEGSRYFHLFTPVIFFELRGPPASAIV